MRKHGLWASIFALGFGVAALSGDLAAKPGEKKGADAKTNVQAGVLEDVPLIDPKEITINNGQLGMARKEFIKKYLAVIDADYLKQFQETEPGIQMERLKNQVEEIKE